MIKHPMYMIGLTVAAYYLGTKIRGYRSASRWENALVPFDSGQRWTPPTQDPTQTQRDLTVKDWTYLNPASWHIDKEKF